MNQTYAQHLPIGTEVRIARTAKKGCNEIPWVSEMDKYLNTTFSTTGLAEYSQRKCTHYFYWMGWAWDCKWLEVVDPKVEDTEIIL